MEKRIELKIDEALSGKTVRCILRNHLGLSTALIRRLKKEEGILLCGDIAKQHMTVSLGDTLLVRISDDKSENIEPINMPLDILFEDADFICLNKPRAMPTHPSQNHHGDTLANGIMYYYREENFTFRVITRLDRDTSGVVLVAKNPLSAQRLADAMQRGEIEKTYIAAVYGVPNPLEGVITAPIRRREDSVILRMAAPDGKHAETAYKVEKEKDGLSLVRLFPKTGRTHQIRVHMAYIGTPIFGDDLYGAPGKGERTRLHCEKIVFPHPSTGEKTEISAPIPSDIEDLFKKCDGYTINSFFQSEGLTKEKGEEYGR